MNRLGYLLLLAVVPLGSGCLTMFRNETRPPQVEMAREVSPITADTVTDTNAAEQAKALRAEIERELKNKPVEETESP